MDLLYPYIPKWVQSVKALRSYDVIKTCWTWKLWFFLRKIGKKIKAKIQKIHYKFWISEFHRAFDVKEITYMPLVTFFSVLERPGKKPEGGVATYPPWLGEG